MREIDRAQFDPKKLNNKQKFAFKRFKKWIDSIPENGDAPEQVLAQIQGTLRYKTDAFY